MAIGTGIEGNETAEKQVKIISNNIKLKLQSWKEHIL